MMRDDQQLNELQNTILDIFMELDSEASEVRQKEATARNLRARRAIEEHFEKKRLKADIKQFEFDDPDD